MHLRLIGRWSMPVVIFIGTLLGNAVLAQQRPEARPHLLSISRDLSVLIAPPWRLTGERRQWVNELQIIDAQGLLVARAVITREDQLNRERATRRLLVAAGPSGRDGELALFEGWPSYRLVLSEPVLTRRGQPTETLSRHYTLAIAMRSIFITIDVQDYSNGGADDAVTELLKSIRVPRSKDIPASERELDKVRDLRGKPWLGVVNPIKLPDATGDRFFPVADSGLNAPVLAVPGWGELEISASPNGRRVVIGTNSGFAGSNDFGETFTRGAGLTPFAVPTTTGDPSTAYGATDRFYISYLAQPNGAGARGTANNFNGCTVPVAATRVAGATNWDYRGDARQCAANINPNSNCFPDQEHIAADARNTVARRLGSGPAVTVKNDQVYAVWRDYSAVVGPGSPTTCAALATSQAPVALVGRAACSSDGGRTWTSVPPAVSTSTNFDYSKITVGRDGSVYMVSALSIPATFRQGGPWTEIWIDKFSSCQSGFQRQAGFPHVVGWLETPACAVGLDRCTNLSSPTLAVSKDFADIVWIGASFPVSTRTNDRVLVALSTDGARNFGGWQQISDNVSSRKFMPWICAAGKQLFATWYDRRPSNANDDSLTDFYLAIVDFDALGPKVRQNVNVSRTPDSHCSSGWPSGTKNEEAATWCQLQPQTYGVCWTNGPPEARVGPNCRPDATPTGCPAGTVCRRTDLGQPKYGDYSGLACAAGYAFTAWATQTPPVVGGAAGVWVRAFKSETPTRSFNNWREKKAVARWWSSVQKP